MMKNRKLLLAALIALVATVALLGALGASDPAPRARDEARLLDAPPAPLAPSASDAPRSGPLGLVAGDLLTYEFEIRHEVASDVPISAEETRTLDLTTVLRGAFTLHVRERADRGWIATLAMVELTADASSTAGQVEQREQPVLGGVTALLEPSGRIARLIFEDGATADARTAWKSILAQWHFTASDAAEWDALERDAMGVRRVHYRRLGAGDISRTLRGYDAVFDADGAALAADVRAEGEARIVLDPLPARIDGHESMEIVIPEMGRTIRSQLRFSFVRAACERCEGAAGAAGERLLRGEGSALHEADAPEVDPAVLRGQARDALAELGRCFQRDEGCSQESQDALLAIVDLLGLGDAAVEEAMADLKAATCSPALSAALTAALAAAGTPAAQGALHSVARDDAFDAERRTQAILALAQVARPVPGTEALLRKLREERAELADSALLVLGAVGDHLRGDERFEAIERDVAAAVNDAPDAAALETALAAMSNMGPARIPDGARRALEHEDDGIRAAAALALLRVRDAEADALLLGLARDDAAAEVRYAALDALLRRDGSGFGRPEGLRALLEQAASDTDANVRELAEQALARA